MVQRRKTIRLWCLGGPEFNPGVNQVPLSGHIHPDTTNPPRQQTASLRALGWQMLRAF
jgi:hypothetical protein